VRADIVLGLVGSVLTLVLLFEMLRRKRLREKYVVFWVLVALSTLAVAAFPSILVWVSRLVGVAVPANLLFFVASMLLLAVSLQHSSELSRLEDRTRVLAEEVGLLRLQVEVQRDQARGAAVEPDVDAR
jgi:hypothetical protein